MATNQIDAKLRILTEAAQSIAALRELKREYLATKAAAKDAGGASGGGGTEGKAALDDAREAGKARQQSNKEDAAALAARKAAEEQARRDRRAARAAEDEAERKARAERRAAERAAAREAQDDARKVRAEVNLQANAMRQLPAQVTDIVSGLATGQKPLTVLIQQGGQLRDSFGSVGGVLRAFTSILTPVRLGLLGVGAAIGFVVTNAIAGYREQDRLNKSLQVTGDVTNATIGQIDTSARRIADSSNTSISDVRDTLQALVDAGASAASSLDQTARAATAYRKITGASAADSAKLFAGQRDSILDWATKANKAYNFLTAAQLDHIRVLQSQGRNDEAVRLANEELAKSLEQRVAPSIGTLERLWNGVAAAVSKVVDAAKGIGRETTIDEKISDARRRLDELLEVERTLAKVQKRAPEDTGAIALARSELAALESIYNRDALRRSERAAAQKTEQDLAFKQSKAFTDAVAAVDLAGQQKIAAQRLAALDKQAADLRTNRAAQVITEQEFNLRMIDIDKQRLQAQQTLLQAQLSIEKNRKTETPLDEQARAASIAQLEAQLVDVQSRINQTNQQAQEVLAADATRQATEWEQAWKEAAERIRKAAQENATTAATRIADPGARADAEARAAVAEQQRELDKQKRDLQLLADANINPVQTRDAQRKLAELRTQGQAAIDEAARKARLQSLQTQLEELNNKLTQGEADLAAAVDQGAISTEEAERRKLSARAASSGQLRLLLQLLQEVADKSSTAEQNEVARARGNVNALSDMRTELEKTARSSGISELADGLTAIETRSKSAGQALRDMVTGFARALLNVINQRLAEELVNSLLDAANGKKSTTNAQNPGLWSAIIDTARKVYAGVNHAGGVIGQSSAHAARLVNPLGFAGAQVLHGGGIAGMMSYADLAPNERRAVLEVGEEVVSEDNPRHIKNYRGGGLQVNMGNVVISGAGGNEAEQASAAQDLQRMMVATIDNWATQQQRQGGILAKR